LKLLDLKANIYIGVKVADKQIFIDILKECDLNDDGEVDFEEFQKCMGIKQADIRQYSSM
jgi:Ca2+-binding EF-hand superfamily protein